MFVKSIEYKQVDSNFMVDNLQNFFFAMILYYEELLSQLSYYKVFYNVTMMRRNV